MAAISAKNFSLSASGQSLGLGDMVRQQLEDEQEERKKKLLGQRSGGALSPTTLSLLGGSGGFGV